MHRLEDAAQTLSSKTGRSRLAADQHELAAWIFGVRVAGLVCRSRQRENGYHSRWRSARGLLRTLECYRKRAKRATKAINGALTADPTWRETLAWIRWRLLVVPKAQSKGSAPRLSRRWYQLVLDEAERIATSALTEAGYIVPNRRELRGALRRVFWAGRRSRQPGTPTLLNNTGVLVDRLVKFLPGLRPIRLEVPSECMPFPEKRASKARKEPPPPSTIPRRSPKRQSRPPFPAQQVEELKSAYPSLSLCVRGDRIAALLEMGISKRKLARHLGVSEGTVRRDLKIASLPHVRAEVERGASAKRLLETERQKAFEASSAARIKLERDTGQPSSELSKLLIELLDREAQWEAGYSLQALNEARRRLGSLPEGLRPRIRLLPAQSPIEVSRPQGAPPPDGVDKLNYLVSWLVRLSFLCAAEDEIRGNALRKAENHFREQSLYRFGQNVTEWF